MEISRGKTLFIDIDDLYDGAKTDAGSPAFINEKYTI
jgi:hypothetical protein